MKNKTYLTIEKFEDIEYLLNRYKRDIFHNLEKWERTEKENYSDAIQDEIREDWDKKSIKFCEDLDKEIINLLDILFFKN